MANNTTYITGSRTAKVIKPLGIRGASFGDYRVVVPSVRTTKRVREIRDILRPSGTTTLTERLLFRKIEKAFGQKDYTIAIQKREIKQLQVTVEWLKPTREEEGGSRSKSEFATIEAIRKAQQEAGR